jgi:hypothetical protein
VFHVEIEIFERIINWLIIFLWIFRTFDFHLNLMLICSLNTQMLIFEKIVMKSMMIVIILLNLFELRVKWINLYLVETNTISCRIAHFSQTRCIIFSDLKFFSIEFLYARMLTLSMNLKSNAAMSSLLIIFSKSAL